MCIIQEAKHKTNLATKCAVQTNQQVQGWERRRPFTAQMLKINKARPERAVWR